MLTRTIRRRLHGARRGLSAAMIALAVLGSGIAGASAAGASTSAPPPLTAEPPLSQDLSGTLPNLNYGQAVGDFTGAGHDQLAAYSNGTW